MNEPIKFFDDSVSLKQPPEDPYIDLLNSSYDYWTHPDPPQEDFNIYDNKPLNDKQQIMNTRLLENTHEAKDKETEESHQDWRVKHCQRHNGPRVLPR